MLDYFSFHMVMEYLGLDKEQSYDCWNRYNEMESIFDGHFDNLIPYIKIWYLQ